LKIDFLVHWHKTTKRSHRFRNPDTKPLPTK